MEYSTVQNKLPSQQQLIIVLTIIKKKSRMTLVTMLKTYRY